MSRWSRSNALSSEKGSRKSAWRISCDTSGHRILWKFSTFDEDALFEVQRGVRAVRHDRVVGDHEHRLAVLVDQRFNQLHDFGGAFAVQVAGRLVAQKKSGIGNDGPRDGYTLFLSAGKLPRIMMHTVGEIDHR